MPNALKLYIVRGYRKSDNEYVWRMKVAATSKSDAIRKAGSYAGEKKVRYVADLQWNNSNEVKVLV